ncbi:MAG: hypothetical protein K2N01_07915 [Lachnospiraceae bacterium]|nr:hypothetical protein [Lachnospiraceae bacterium]
MDNYKRLTSATAYQTKIIEIVQNTENIWILEQILRFIKNMIKEGD